MKNLDGLRILRVLYWEVLENSPVKHATVLAPVVKTNHGMTVAEPFKVMIFAKFVICYDTSGYPKTMMSTELACRHIEEKLQHLIASQRG